MRAERAITALLGASPGIAAHVGAGAAARIYGAAAPAETAAPLLIYSLQTAEREPVLDPVSERMVHSLVEVLCVAPTYGALKELAEQVRLALNGARGMHGGTEVFGITIDAEGGDQYEAQLDEYAKTWTFRVYHTE